MIVGASFIVNFHSNFARVVLIYSALMALWGLGLYFAGRNPSPSYLGSLVLEEAIAIFQGLLGVIVLGGGNRPHDGLHYLYGVVLVITLPAAYFYSARGTERRDSLIFGLATLFMLGIAIRGITTGG
ncbi:MAG TPA: hypothetical protein VKX16_08600 [Chloroflexota bacterium]|nr:hypothetical protein [Chloroflexota bacterium]